MIVRLDLNNPEFQAEWFALQKEDFIAARNTLRKLCSMNWNQVCRDKGLHWEKIQSLKTDKNLELYTIRLSRKHRAPANPEHCLQVLSRTGVWERGFIKKRGLQDGNIENGNTETGCNPSHFASAGLG